MQQDTSVLAKDTSLNSDVLAQISLIHLTCESMNSSGHMEPRVTSIWM